MRVEGNQWLFWHEGVRNRLTTTAGVYSDEGSLLSASGWVIKVGAGSSTKCSTGATLSSF